MVLLILSVIPAVIDSPTHAAQFLCSAVIVLLKNVASDCLFVLAHSLSFLAFCVQSIVDSLLISLKAVSLKGALMRAI